MTMPEQQTITQQALQKMSAAIALVQASLEKLEPYDNQRAYTADEKEKIPGARSGLARETAACRKMRNVAESGSAGRLALPHFGGFR